ncbi:hypothetical protein [Nonomuraea sp. NPDC049400]|uniref:hypothetical protein n=1 Tax=Nonomuraea sp. NPDC049400 TaxID=3364352 RepID=UPI0037908D4A
MIYHYDSPLFCAEPVVDALETCPLAVCQELFLSETARHADVVLPAALAEYGQVAPVFGGISHQWLDREGALAWPCPNAGHPRTAKLCMYRFATADGLARLAARPNLPPGEGPDGDYPLILVTGRRRAHYNAP